MEGRGVPASGLGALAYRLTGGKRPRSAPAPRLGRRAPDATDAPTAGGTGPVAAPGLGALAARLSAPARVRPLAARPPLERIATPAAGLDAEEAIAATMEAITARCRDLLMKAPSTTTRNHWASAHRSFSEFCARVRVPTLHRGKLDHYVVMAWLEDKCDNADNATSVDQWTSQLYRYFECMEGAPAYNKVDDATFFERARAALAKEYGVKVKRPLAITAAVLRRIHEALRPDLNPKWRNFWVHVLAAYHWLLRPNEHLGDVCDLTAKDVTFSLEGAARARIAHLRVNASKGLRRQGAAKGEYEMTYTRETAGPLDLIAPLTAYIAEHGFAARPDAPFFPALNADGSLASGYMSMDAFNARLRTMLRAAGLATEFSARGLRSGRRSDLRNCNTPADVVCQLGRWKSEPTSFRYQRTAAMVALQIIDTA